MHTLYQVFHYCNNKLSRSSKIETSVIDYYDLTIVKSGTLSYMVNGRRIWMQEGDVILLPPQTRRSREALAQPTHYFSFNFYANEPIDLPMFMQGGANSEIYALFNAFTPHHLSDEKRSHPKAAHIVGYILEVLIDINQRASQNPHIQKAIDYIDNHVSEPITLSQIATHLHLSREYVAGLFKKETGMTVSQYVNEQKLMRACDLLRDTPQNLTEIALSLGYSDYSYFSYIFKKRFGVSPSHFLK